jgi:hypothetical protein
MLFSKQLYFDSNGLFYFPGCFPSNSILTACKIKIIHYCQNTVAWKITWKIKNNPLLSKYCCLENNLKNKKIIHYCQNTVAWKITWKIKIIHY